MIVIRFAAVRISLNVPRTDILSAAHGFPENIFNPTGH